MKLALDQLPFVLELHSFPSPNLLSILIHATFLMLFLTNEKSAHQPMSFIYLGSTIFKCASHYF